MSQKVFCDISACLYVMHGVRWSHCSTVYSVNTRFDSWLFSRPLLLVRIMASICFFKRIPPQQLKASYDCFLRNPHLLIIYNYKIAHRELRKNPKKCLRTLSIEKCYRVEYKNYRLPLHHHHGNSINIIP